MKATETLDTAFSHHPQARAALHFLQPTPFFTSLPAPTRRCCSARGGEGSAKWGC